MACLTPVPIRVARYVDPLRKEYDLSSFACGKCPNCVKNRARGWAFRLMREERKATKAFFVTLTYREKYLPYSAAGLPTLEYDHLRTFIMRCRKAMKSQGIEEKLIYYAVGEYGSKNWRPHYHIIMFNCPEDIIVNAWMWRGANGKEEPEQLGHVHFGNVSEPSIIYTCKYISKPSRIPLFEGDDRVKETSRMSKFIGIDYVQNPDVLAWHKADVLNRLYLPLKDGKKWALPRYYKRKIYDLEEVKLIQEYFSVMADTIAIEKTDEEWLAEAQLVNHKFEQMYETYYTSRWL